MIRLQVNLAVFSFKTHGRGYMKCICTAKKRQNQFSGEIDFVSCVNYDSSLKFHMITFFPTFIVQLDIFTQVKDPKKGIF